MRKPLCSTNSCTWLPMALVGNIACLIFSTTTQPYPLMRWVSPKTGRKIRSGTWSDPARYSIVKDPNKASTHSSVSQLTVNSAPQSHQPAHQAAPKHPSSPAQKSPQDQPVTTPHQSKTMIQVCGSACLTQSVEFGFRYSDAGVAANTIRFDTTALRALGAQVLRGADRATVQSGKLFGGVDICILESSGT